MSLEHVNTRITLNTAVANGATFTVPYPSGTDQQTFANNLGDSYIVTRGNNVYREADGKIAVAFGASEITVTNSTGRALEVGVPIQCQFSTGTKDAMVSVSGVDKVVKITQAAYDALAVKDETTLYLIVG